MATATGGGRHAVAMDSSIREQYAAMAHAYEPRPVDTLLRACDILIASTVLLVLAPLQALTAALILLTSGRPILYRGERVGRAGQIFEMYKFRTLAADAETRLGPYYGEELSRRTEQEMIRGAHLLRVTHLDEVPQLWNVLRGEMSMVGPRPIRPSFFAELSEHIPQYWQRLVLRPGVTGFAQVRVDRTEAWAYKLAHDMEYIADRSLALYFKVLAETARKVLRSGSDDPFS
jgi:lipopolysaccharide/colanic/teichoic acid biosynthesis glycosyltransferase